MNDDDAPEMSVWEIEEAFVAAERQERKETAGATIAILVLAPALAAYIGLLCGIAGGVCVNIFRWITR